MDELIEKVGAFGKFQYKVIVIVGLISALSSACIYATIFIAAEPEFFCTRQNATTDTDIIDSTNILNETTFSSCKIWIQMRNSSSNTSEHYKCEFDKTFYDKTIINEYLLICDNSYKAGLTQTLHMFGSIFAFYGGIVGDRYGRRRSVLIFSLLLTLTLILSQSLLSITAFNLSTQSKYIIYSVSQFLIGLLVNCVYCTAYVLLMEFTTEKYRTKIANLNSYSYVLGELIVLVVYYVSRDWHVLNWVIGVYSLVLLILMYFYLPESSAWLISINKLPKALAVLHRIANVNRKNKSDITLGLIKSIKYQDNYLNNSTIETSSVDFLSTVPDSVDDGDEKISEENNSPSDFQIVKEIFYPKKTLLKTSLLFYVWASLMLLYYGISLGVTSVELVNPYLMYLLSAIAEIVGYVFCYLNDIFGRKKTLSGFFFTTTLMYALIAYLSTDSADQNSATSFSFKAIVLMCLALVGKCSVSGAYNISYIYTSELYPTLTRNTAVLFLTCFGSVSSLIAPQINMLKSLVWNPLPYIIYSLCALFACLCVWYLPETRIK